MTTPPGWSSGLLSTDEMCSNSCRVRFVNTVSVSLRDKAVIILLASVLGVEECVLRRPLQYLLG